MNATTISTEASILDLDPYVNAVLRAHNHDVASKNANYNQLLDSLLEEFDVLNSVLSIVLKHEYFGLVDCSATCKETI